jgi:MerR family transcriptional regulator/heat shock protein HspR
MDEKVWTWHEVIEVFEVQETFLLQLEDEEILCPVCPQGRSEKTFSANDLEKLRLIKILVEEMGVNLAGVEIILRMRQRMFDMRRQFDGILEDMARKLRDSLEDETA